MTGRGGGGGRRVLLPPINFIFKLLQQQATVQVWLYEQLSIRIEGKIRASLLASGLPGTGVLDSVVFKKLKEATGGRLKLCMSGGGPIAKETQHFISMAIAPMIIGYGLTETTAMGCLMNPLEWNTNNMGAMPASIEIKLVD
ncbi:hypothetical protein BN1708_018167, partial [Verticillium longisporum]